MAEKGPLDESLILAVAILVVCGVVFVYDASFARAGLVSSTHFDPQYYLKRQVLWVCLGIVAFLVAKNTPYWVMERLAVASLVLALGLLVAVLVVGVGAQDTKRALAFGGFRFQPAEFAKLALVLFLARWMKTNGRRLRHLTAGFLPLVGLLGVVGLLIERQPDLGTAAVAVGTGVMMLFLGGARKRHLAMLLAAGALAIVVMITSKPYRMGRILAWRDPTADPTGRGYQVLHSLIALGTGGFIGVGLGHGRQKYFYLPAAPTDYVLSTVAEELGFLGTMGVFLLFLALTVRGLEIAYNSQDVFGSLVAGGISCMIAVQALLNIAVVTNQVPSTGVPLPFVSYGGSSLVVSLFAVGLLVNIAQHPTGEQQPSRRVDTRHEVPVDWGWNRRTRVPGARYR